MTGAAFYCGITGEKRWNSHPMQPGALACVSPVHGRSVKTRRDPSPTAVPTGTAVLLDSGAFSDSREHRVHPALALERQLRHMERYEYADKVSHLCSYDLLIDEKWSTDGTRKKQRWSELEAESAVRTTIDAADYLSRNRHQIPGITPVLSAQGVMPKQYLRCASHVIDCMEAGDVLGLGGWCILGLLQKVASLQECFRRTINSVIPYAARRGVKRVHIFGVIYPNALGKLLHIASEHGIEVSTDSLSPSLYPTNKQWGYGDPKMGGWRDNHHVFRPLAERGLERAEHVRLTRDWLTRLDTTQWYVNPMDKRVIVKFEKPIQHKMAI